MKSLSLKNKIMAALAIALCAVIVGFLIYTAVVIVNGVKPKAPAVIGDDTVYDVNFGGNISLLGVDYEVALQGNDGEFTVNAGRISDVTGGTYTFTEGQGWTFSFADASNTVVRSQFDDASKTFSFVYHLDLGSRGAGNLRFSFTDEDFTVDGEPWVDIPSFGGTAVWFGGAVSAGCSCSCDAEGNFTIFSEPTAAAAITSITGTYEFTGGVYVLTAADGTVYTSTVNADGLHEIALKVFCPQLAAYGDAIAYTDLVLTQIVLTVD